MEANIRVLRNDMQKFNVLIAKNATLQSELAEQNLFLETEFMGQLREMESDAISLEERIEEGKKEKERLVQDIIDLEYVSTVYHSIIQPHLLSPQGTCGFYGRRKYS